MKIIFGLGNTGAEYVDTRHNIGFWVLDEYIKQFPEAAFASEPKFFADIATITVEGEKILLVKPTTLMNVSGKSVRALLDFYKLTASDILVLHDDLDIPLENIRVTKSSGSAGHNGVADIIATLGTQEFSRIRIGIGRPDDVLGTCMEGHDYVLGKLTNEEKKVHQQKLPQIIEALQAWLSL